MTQTNKPIHGLLLWEGPVGQRALQRDTQRLICNSMAFLTQNVGENPRQLYHYLKVNSILSKFQSGFRSLHSTVSALIQMCDDWSDSMDKGKLTGVVFLDIRKAFDSVDHSILLEKVQFYIVADRELMWHKSYLPARKQQCLINGCLSSQSNLLCGVPQGSILGPLCYNSCSNRDTHTSMGWTISLYLGKGHTL